MNTDKHRFSEWRSTTRTGRFLFSSVFICVHLWLISSCSTKPTDVRAVVPGDALVYLETQDLGKALRAVTENDAFKSAAKTQPDLSALDGIKLAVAVTGFETKEEQVTEENAVLNFQPRFVAVAETNAWNFQAIKFAENKLGEFINHIYGGGVELERFPRDDGDYFVWTADDGRKAYGLVIGSLIFFGNDETAIEKCVAVRKGEAESMAKNSKLPSGDLLASGYLSPDGVAQVSSIATIQLAVGAGEEEEVRGFIARVLPDVLRKSITEVTWMARKTEQGIEDVFNFATGPEIGNVLKETIRPTGSTGFSSVEFVPADVVSATRYDLADPQIAWRSILLTAQKQTDGLSGTVMGAVAESLFEPYGIDAPEEFLSSIGGQILSLRFDPEGEEVVAIVTTKDLGRLKKSLAKEFKLTVPAEKVGGADVWRSEEGEPAFAVVGEQVLLGHAESVLKCLNSTGHAVQLREQLTNAGVASAVTIASDVDPDATLATVLAERPDDKKPLVQRYRISTAFNGGGIQRTEVSEFGLIGSVIEQFAKEQ